MFRSLARLFKQLTDGNDLSHTNALSAELAITALLCEVANADHRIDEEENQRVIHFLNDSLQVEHTQAQSLLTKAKQHIAQSASLYEYTSQLRELSAELRIDVIRGMWQVAIADGSIDPLEEAVIRKTAELLYVDHSLFIKAKLDVLKHIEPNQ